MAGDEVCFGSKRAGVPSALRLLTTITAEGRQRRQAVAAWSAAGAAAGASGFVVASVVSDLASWRLIFAWILAAAVSLTAAVMFARAGQAPPRGTNQLHTHR
ncbi:MAG: hypothetical protein JOY89_11525 [Solirubrobacterales bacterium]|nr:hypothetical protein [Solirubrobacterales bacterium]